MKLSYGRVSLKANLCSKCVTCIFITLNVPAAVSDLKAEPGKDWRGGLCLQGASFEWEHGPLSITAVHQSSHSVLKAKVGD